MQNASVSLLPGNSPPVADTHAMLLINTTTVMNLEVSSGCFYTRSRTYEKEKMLYQLHRQTSF